MQVNTPDGKRSQLTISGRARCASVLTIRRTRAGPPVWGQKILAHTEDPADRGVGLTIALSERTVTEASSSGATNNSGIRYWIFMEDRHSKGGFLSSATAVKTG